MRPEVLLVDDNPADIDLMREILGGCKQPYHVNSVKDGQAVISYLHREGGYAGAPFPDLVVLDLNLPGKDGRTVLKEMKSDARFAKIPIVIFTTSQASSDIATSYELGANCYLRKPGTLSEYRAIVQSMADFWLGSVTLPNRRTHDACFDPHSAD
jgi:two-component system response regulator